MILTLETLKHYVEEEGECLLWKNGINKHGYPQARINGETRLVKHVLFDLSGRTHRRGHVLSMSCFNRKCVNPEHIVQWTRAYCNQMSYKTTRNVQHEIAARRANAAKLGGKWAHKLTMEKAREIRQLEGQLSHREIAEKFGIARSTVGEILRGRRWKECANSVFALTAA